MEAGSLATYCALVGYLLVDQLDRSFKARVLFTAAMAIHLLGVAHKLRQYEPRIYDRFSRWVLLGSLYAGWALAMLTSLPDRLVALWVSFLAGALVIVATREEIPRDRDIRYVPFLCGAVAFTALDLLAESL